MLGWPNRSHKATFSGGDWMTELPLDNLKDDQITKVTRSNGTDLADTLFDIDFGEVKTLRCFSIPNHNLSQVALWRVTMGSSAGLSDIYDSTWMPIWVLTFNDDTLPWESNNWWGGISDDEHIGAPYAATHITDDFYSSRYARIEINDTTNAHGYVQVGGIFTGGGFLPKYGMSLGMSDAWESLTQVQQADSGSEWFNKKRSYRVVRFILELIELGEFDTLYELVRRQGISEQILYVPDVDDPVMQQRTGFIGRMRQLNNIEYPYPRHRKLPVEMKELI